MSNDDPFRTRIQKALSAALEEITPANGYNFNFAGKVFRGRLYFGEGDPIPMLSILEPPIPLDPASAPINASNVSTNYRLIVQGFVDDDRRNPTDPAGTAMAEVKKRLAVEQKRKHELPRRDSNPFGMNYERGNRVESLVVGSGTVRPPEPTVSNKAYFWLTLDLKINEDNSDPFG